MAMPGAWCFSRSQSENGMNPGGLEEGAIVAFKRIAGGNYCGVLNAASALHCSFTAPTGAEQRETQFEVAPATC